MDIEQGRERLINVATERYAGNQLDQSDFEDLVTRITDARTLDEMDPYAILLTGRPLANLVNIQGAAVPAVRELQLNMGNMRKTGDWVDAPAYCLSGHASNFRLDFTAYEHVEGFALQLELDIKSSNLRLIVPHGWRVEDKITSNSMSRYIDRGSREAWSGNTIVVSGSISMSNVKVKYR